MKLEGDYRFDASVQEVWDALFDPAILAAVMPGCEKLELIDGHYVGEIKIKVGPVQGKFTGKVELVDKEEPRRYRMIVDGRGAPGFVKATATVALEAEGEGTRIRYDADAQVGGKIASVGQRLLEASSRAIVAQSLEGLHANIKLRAAAYREAPAKADTATTTAEPTEPAPVPAATTAEPTEPAPTPAATTPAPAPEPVSEAEPPAAIDPAPAAATTPAPAPTESVKPASPAKPAIEFTPIKVQQSALAKSVAKEVASTMFPRSVLVAIILLQSAVIAWLLLR
ncbi:MAG TPA: carbon monoxide dehydrogenase subunit G [Kofleriaceae bacterium]|nr:carbon monoxide dehydrogenase subunit G [Kofleriaceae bacterium]